MEIINLQFIDRLYEDLNKEHVKLLSSLKTPNPQVEDIKKYERLVQRKMAIITSLMTNSLKLRNIIKMEN